jgi:hypothetical protein
MHKNSAYVSQMSGFYTSLKADITSIQENLSVRK